VNGILNVSAKDLGTSKEQKISITGSSGLSKEEIERMQREGEAHAEEDRKARENAEVRNNADNLAYQCEKQLKDLGDKIPADKKGGVEKAVEKVRETLKGSDVEAIKTAYTDLQNQFQGISEDLYKNAGATADGSWVIFTFICFSLNVNPAAFIFNQPSFSVTTVVATL
jgi:molecular chaperone DnaK